MHAYRFRLLPVLRVRQLQEEQRRIELAVARRAQDEAASAGEVRRSRFAAARAAVVEDPSPSSFLRRRDHQDRMLDALVAAQMAEAHAADLRRRHHEEWEAAVAALRALERLDERARRAHRLELERSEQHQLDELATTWARSSRAQPGSDREEP